jgi:hypothetical protein
MATIDEESWINRVARQGQIIVGALILGLVTFLGIASVIDLGAPQPAQAGANPGGGVGGPAAPGQDLSLGRLLTWMAIGFAAIDLPLSFLVAALITRQNRRAIASGRWPPPQTRLDTGAPPTDAGKLAAVYSTQLIVAAAMIEGAAFFAGVAYLVGKDPIALGVGLLLIGVLITRFPTTDRVTRWIARQEELLLAERQAA